MTVPAENSLTLMYRDVGPFAGVTGRRRKQLMLLHRAFHRPFDALQAASVLDMDVDRDTPLACCARQKWLGLPVFVGAGT